VKARIYPDSEGEQWIIADDDQKYVDGPFIEIPDEVGEPMRRVQGHWAVVSKAFTEWVESQIEANGGDDYRDYLAGELTEAQLEARRGGCTHPNVTNTGSDRFPASECLDCGRRHYPERWL
jgi:hypothetical protein